jgi:hypothetical protein
MLFAISAGFKFQGFRSFLLCFCPLCSFSWCFVGAEPELDQTLTFHFFCLKGSLFEARDWMEPNAQLVSIIFVKLLHTFGFVPGLQEPFELVDYFCFTKWPFFSSKPMQIKNFRHQAHLLTEVLEIFIFFRFSLNFYHCFWGCYLHCLFPN